VHVQWREGEGQGAAAAGEGEIEVSNPGGFPDEVRVGSLLVTPPRPRNPLLADAFKRIGLVERTGRGIDTIFEGQLRYGRPLPDYSRSTGANVQVVLNGGPANVALAKFIISKDVPGSRVSIDEMLVVNAVERERRIDVARASSLIQRPEGAARSVLERLVEAGIIEASAPRPAPGGVQRLRDLHYHFSAATYAALGAPEAYARVRSAAAEGPDPREAAILRHVDATGRISRSEAADVCGIEGREARAVLERLVNRGELEVRGEKRGAHYVRPEGAMAESDAGK
jgi:ATP-dependent DNA helicase RecG